MNSRIFFLCFSGACLSVITSASVTNRIDENFSDVPRSYQEANQKANQVEEESSWLSFPTQQINMIQRMLNDCSEGDPFSVCLKTKAVTFLDRVLRKDSIPLADGLSLVADANSSRARSGRALTEEELVASLPREIGKKEETLDQLILGKLSEFFKVHKLQLDLSDNGSTDVVEARKKGKKILPYLLMAKLWAAGNMALALTGIAAIAMKALLVGKVALVISAIIGLKKLFSHGQQDHHTYEVLATEHHQDHHGRTFNTDPHGSHSLAYRAYANEQN